MFCQPQQLCASFCESLRSFELRQRFLLHLLVDFHVLLNTGFEEFKPPESGNKASWHTHTHNWPVCNADGECWNSSREGKAPPRKKKPMKSTETSDGPWGPGFTWRLAWLKPAAQPPHGGSRNWGRLFSGARGRTSKCCPRGSQPLRWGDCSSCHLLLSLAVNTQTHKHTRYNTDTWQHPSKSRLCTDLHL